MGTDLTAILFSSVFLGVGFVIAKFFPEAALLAAVFLVGLAILNLALVLVGGREKKQDLGLFPQPRESSSCSYPPFEGSDHKRLF